MIFFGKFERAYASRTLASYAPASSAAIGPWVISRKGRASSHRVTA